MQRVAILGYGLISYAIGMFGLVCFMLYMGGWDFLPLHIDSREPGPLGVALLVNAALMLLFGVQHTVMARGWFKVHWTSVIPAAAERSTYVLLSGVLMLFICWFWMPVRGVVWNIDDETAWAAIAAIQVFGWLVVVGSSFMTNHFDLFGLRQVYCHLRNETPAAPKFAERLLYKLVRHPLQLGLLIGMWSTATMSMTHLLLAGGMTIYIRIGLYYEEQDLLASFGEVYEEYRSRVRLLFPIPSRAR
jgi:protein-S-isoprenylcysteine O-methyltransferase Ste14